jgi:hypothetical protein
MRARCCTSISKSLPGEVNAKRDPVAFQSLFFFLVGVGNEARNRTFSLLFCTFKIAIYASLNQCRSTHCAAIAARTTHQRSTSFRSAFECTHFTCAEILGATGTSESICFTIVTLHCCTLAAIGMYSIFPTEESESLAILVHFIATIVVPFFLSFKKKTCMTCTVLPSPDVKLTHTGDSQYVPSSR